MNVNLEFHYTCEELPEDKDVLFYTKDGSFHIGYKYFDRFRTYDDEGMSWSAQYTLSKVYLWAYLPVFDPKVI